MAFGFALEVKDVLLFELFQVVQRETFQALYCVVVRVLQYVLVKGSCYVQAWL